MASRWWSASMLLASLMSLYWMTSADQPHVPLTADLSPSYRVRRGLPEDTKEIVQASAQVFTNALTVVNDIFKLDAVKDASKIIGKISNCASLVPGIGGLVSSVISMSLAFIPQDDPVLKAVQEGFAEVNRKLNSLSIQISDLKTDVEWHNYISTYSQDESRIINVWNKFCEFLKASKLMRNPEDKRRLAQTFIQPHEEREAENSMSNLQRYLTVSHTSLSANINELLKKKFKCDVGQIGRYNLYLNSLLWKGMLVNQFYWNLKTKLDIDKKAKHTEMFKNVIKAQKSTIKFCLDNYEEYMKTDVTEKATTFSQTDKQAIAFEVKKILDQKYNWYSWVVLVYDQSNDKNMILYNMTKISVGDLTVAVAYTGEGPEEWKNQIIEGADKCFKDKECTSLEKLPKCEFFVPFKRFSSKMTSLLFADFAKIAYVAYGEDYKVEPKPFHKVVCPWITWKSYESTIFIYYSKKMPVCTDNKCKNGKCERLLNSNESWCKCNDGYYGDTCEKKMMFLKQ